MISPPKRSGCIVTFHGKSKKDNQSLPKPTCLPACDSNPWPPKTPAKKGYTGFPRITQLRAYQTAETASAESIKINTGLKPRLSKSSSAHRMAAGPSAKYLVPKAAPHINPASKADGVSPNVPLKTSA